MRQHAHPATPTMLLERVREQLGWPGVEQILMPRGAGPRVYAALARRKIEQALRRHPDGASARVGILSRDLDADATEAPLAIVCEFARRVSDVTLWEAHRLAWNFCRSRLLILIEPHRLRAFSCCRRPEDQPTLAEHSAEIHAAPVDPATGALGAQAAESLRWIRLVSGELFERHRDDFREDGRADQLLLDNLRHVRRQLIQGLQLDSDVAHDLLARILFIQFLSDRKDSSGRPALGERELFQLHAEGILTKPHRNLAEILASHGDTYRLFRWLNDKFNGDLFPGKGATEAQREAEWRREMGQVRRQHLQLLADLVGGRLELDRGQYALWRLYAFDAIPLDFISSIYEEFVGEARGVHYTPGYLVDTMLDGVLPWNSEAWDLKVLDPACGSGIFLVKAFQRLVHRWRRAHPAEEPRAEDLRRLLERNLFGVDKDPHAVRVASFSLYLAMCDEIDPRHYWKQVSFPPLRDRRLIHADFFEERGGIRTDADAASYDLTVGNAPWGEETTGAMARRWARNHGWPAPNKSVGPLFLAKAAALTVPEGRVSMIQPAGTLLFNRGSTAAALRTRLFQGHKVEEVVNLSALRFQLFNRKTRKAKPPACIITMQPTPPDGEPLSYICPKPHAMGTDCIVIEPHDIHEVDQEDAAHEPWVWTALLWGSRRDLELVRRMARRASLAKVGDGLRTRLGIVRGDRAKAQAELLGRRILEAPEFPPNTFLRLSARDLEVNEDIFTASRDSVTLEPFNPPQLIIRRPWDTTSGRFQAVLVDTDDETGGVLCSQRYASIHAAEVSPLYLEAACLCLNSLVAVYFLFLTGGSLASYIPHALVGELLDVPIPEPRPGLLDGLADLAELDARVRDALALKEVDWVLIEDFLQYTIPLIRAAGSTGTAVDSLDWDEQSHLDLRAYCEHLLRVLKAGTGGDASATIFCQHGGPPLPVCLVAVHLTSSAGALIREENVAPRVLWEELEELNRRFLARRPAGTGGVFFQRVARIYDLFRVEGRDIPTVYLVKPRDGRYWSRSMALRDADEVVADALGSAWARGAGEGSW